jgi:glycogen debranching enzyme
VLTLNQSACSELEKNQDKEWLITNGIGGYASSTVAGLNTRRYHGLPVAATTPPAGRLLMLPKFTTPWSFQVIRQSLR